MCADVLQDSKVGTKCCYIRCRLTDFSLHLAHNILHNPNILRHCTNPSEHPTNTGQRLPSIVELGAGSGFLSILLSQLGADIIATDLGDENVGSELQCIWDSSRLSNGVDDAKGTTFKKTFERQTPLGRLKGNIELSRSLSCGQWR